MEKRLDLASNFKSLWLRKKIGKGVQLSFSGVFFIFCDNRFADIFVVAGKCFITFDLIQCVDGDLNVPWLKTPKLTQNPTRAMNCGWVWSQIKQIGFND